MVVRFCIKFMGFQAFFIYFDWRIQRSIEHKIWKFEVVESSPSIPIHNTTHGHSPYKGNIPVYHFCEPPPVHTPLCSGAPGHLLSKGTFRICPLFRLISNPVLHSLFCLLIIVLQQSSMCWTGTSLPPYYNLHTSEARQFSLYWY